MVTGGSSWSGTDWWPQLVESLNSAGIQYEQITVMGEPSPELVDKAVQQFSQSGIDAVVAVGGGSAMDAAKAIAGLLLINQPVLDYLEGVGPELKDQEKPNLIAEVVLSLTEPIPKSLDLGRLE